MMCTFPRVGRARAAIAVFVILIATSTRPVAAQPHALVPLPTPLYSIDFPSPTVFPPLAGDDVLEKVGGNPTIAFPGPGMGLVAPRDELDGFSFNHAHIPISQTFLFLFSVDRDTVGAVPPDPGLVALNRPYNVQHQAQRNQAAADMFMNLDGYTRTGPVGPEVPVFQNNTLVMNQADEGGIDFGLKPEVPAAETVPEGAPTDNVDGMGYAPASFGPEGETAPALYFTVTRATPSLPALPGNTMSGADIFFDPNPLVGGNEMIYATPAQLGLIAGPNGDEIDSVVVFDNPPIGQLNPGNDQILFSLAPGSPTLDLGGHSPADIFTSIGTGAFNVLAQQNDLGLAQSDNIDGLELLVTNNVSQSVLNHSIIFVPTAIPTLGEWGLIVLALLITACGIIVFRRTGALATVGIPRR